jgi:hypothetical protein
LLEAGNDVRKNILPQDAEDVESIGILILGKIYTKDQIPKSNAILIPMGGLRPGTSGMVKGIRFGIIVG